jgi:hypothetical protein
MSMSGYALVFLALLVMATGSGLFKPIISGAIARTTDERTSGLGFGIYYWMINLGAFLAPLVVSVLSTASTSGSRSGSTCPSTAATRTSAGDSTASNYGRSSQCRMRTTASFSTARTSNSATTPSGGIPPASRPRFDRSSAGI